MGTPAREAGGFLNLSQWHLGPYPGSVGVKAKKQWHAHLETSQGILSQEQTQVGNRYLKFFFLSAEEWWLTLAAHWNHMAS